MNVWRDDSPDFVELESMRIKHALLDTIYSYVKMYQDYYGQDMQIIADPVHKQLFEEFRRRFDIPVMPAEKVSKFDWIITWNTDARAGNIKIVDPESSPHVEEMKSLTWKTKRDGWKIEQPGATNDTCDAHLLAFRHAYHYRYEEKTPAPKPGSIEFHKQEEKKMLAEIEAIEARDEREWYDVE